MLKHVKGNLIDMALEGKFDVIIHGCNCFHTMGAGIAKEIAARIPVAVKADLNTPYADVFKLGYCSTGTFTDGNIEFDVVNAYTQFTPGPCAEYSALEKFLLGYRPSTKRVGVPWIGCGIGGLDIEIVKNLFDRYWFGVDVTMVEFYNKLTETV